jgi:shikimate dehydrogenase
MKKACVIGWPIAHSRSPLIHNHWLKTYGIMGLYEKREVKPEDLSTFLNHLHANGYVGCNVTIPHKQAAIACVSTIDDIVKKTGSLNTIYTEQGLLNATSTDGEGFYQNLITNVPDTNLSGKTAVILGAGGSARAVIERLQRANMAKIHVINRTQARAQEMATVFGTKVIPSPTSALTELLKSTDLLVNTTSQGMKGQPELDIDLSGLPKRAIVADLIYVPLKTKLMEQAEARGLKTVGGLGMLLHQAVVGFEKWFGIKPEVTPELYRLVARDIDPEFI